jgi:acyl carrier protein
LSDVPVQDFTDKLGELLRQEIDLALPSVDTDLIEEGVIDSMIVAEIVLLVERKLDITIPLEELEIETFRSVRSLAAFLEPRVPKREVG